MDASLAVKPVAHMTAAGTARSDVPAVRQAVATDLGAAKAVAATTETLRTPLAATRSFALVRDFMADPQSREVMFRALGQGAYRLARERREQALRRRQAYDGTLARGEPDRGLPERTDLQA